MEYGRAIRASRFFTLLSSRMHSTETRSLPQQAALALAALGVVYGDIGTSPLYTMKEVFAGNHPIPLTPENVLGILSLIVWSLIVVVSIKYVVFVMRADNRGEGGIMALIALACTMRAAIRAANAPS